MLSAPPGKPAPMESLVSSCTCQWGWSGVGWGGVRQGGGRQVNEECQQWYKGARNREVVGERGADEGWRGKVMSYLGISGSQLRPAGVQQLSYKLPLNGYDRYADEIFDGTERERTGLMHVENTRRRVDRKRPLQVVEVRHICLHEDEQHVQQSAPVDLPSILKIERFE